MDVYLLDNDFEITAIVDDFMSLIWRRKYFDVGDFELHCSHDLFAVISAAKYVYRPDRREIGIIENYGLEYPTAYCKGRFLERILYDRVIYPTFKVTNKTQEVMALMLVTAHFPSLATGEISGIGTAAKRQVTGDNLMEYVYSILKTAEASISVTCDLNSKTLTVSVWQGHDRRASAIFSPEWDNLVSLSYEYSDKDFKNYAIIAGEGEGSERETVIVDRTNGEEQREIYVDARDLQLEEGESLEDYRARLTQRGEEKLAEYTVVEKCDTVIDAQSNLTYMRDFDLGDICTVAESRHGISCEKRITECEEVYENGSFSLSVTFGEDYKILKNYLKRELK